jgi:hypothetical protein
MNGCGVFFLEQSDTDETIALGQGEAAAYVNRSVTQVCDKYLAIFVKNEDLI